MAKLRLQEPLARDPGPDVLSEHEGAEPSRNDLEGHARWRQVRADRLRREQERRGDPRWALLPTPMLTPAMQFLLLTGTHAAARLPGWVTTAQAGTLDEPKPDHVWWAHCDSLTAEAARHGFQPFWLTKKRPRGAAFDAWRTRFLALHTY
jgi:hypothetical protein